MEVVAMTTATVVASLCVTRYRSEEQQANDKAKHTIGYYSARRLTAAPD